MTANRSGIDARLSIVVPRPNYAIHVAAQKLKCLPVCSLFLVAHQIAPQCVVLERVSPHIFICPAQ